MEQAEAYKYKLSRLIKAVSGFRKIVEIDTSKFNLLIKDAIKNARIQKFEYCTELLWKIIKTFLYLNEHSAIQISVYFCIEIINNPKNET